MNMIVQLGAITNPTIKKRSLRMYQLAKIDRSDYQLSFFPEIETAFSENEKRRNATQK